MARLTAEVCGGGCAGLTLVVVAGLAITAAFAAGLLYLGEDVTWARSPWCIGRGG
jgi:hypothetical protein